MRHFILAIFICVNTASLCFAEGLGTLIEVAKAQGEIQKQYAEETRSYEKVKRAIERGDIKNGDSKEDVLRRYGDPIVVVPEAGTGREKWVYKPASSDYFKGEKAYLFFDKNNMLDEAVIENNKADGKKIEDRK